MTDNGSFFVRNVLTRCRWRARRVGNDLRDGRREDPLFKRGRDVVGVDGFGQADATRDGLAGPLLVDELPVLCRYFCCSGSRRGGGPGPRRGSRRRRARIRGFRRHVERVAAVDHVDGHGAGDPLGFSPPHCWDASPNCSPIRSISCSISSNGVRRDIPVLGPGWPLLRRRYAISRTAVRPTPARAPSAVDGSHLRERAVRAQPPPAKQSLPPGKQG